MIGMSLASDETPPAAPRGMNVVVGVTPRGHALTTALALRVRVSKSIVVRPTPGLETHGYGKKQAVSILQSSPLAASADRRRRGIIPLPMTYLLMRI